MMNKNMRVGVLSVWIAAVSAAGITGCTSKENSRHASEVSTRTQFTPAPAPAFASSAGSFAVSEPHKEEPPLVHSEQTPSISRSSSGHTEPLPEASVVHIPTAPAQAKAAPSVSASSAAYIPPGETTTPQQKPKETVNVIRIPVLNYHSIGADPGNNAVLDPKKLEEQMAYLAKEGYTPLTLRQFIDIWEGKLPAPPKSVLLTFDDGYADNHEKALPILKKYNFHATLFMSPGTVGDGWYIDWNQAKALHEAGWDLQPHGMTHPYLNKLPADKQRVEIEEAAKQIEAHLGIKAEVFCYPYGAFNKETIKILSDNKYKLAFTIEQGFAESTQSPLALKRLFIGGSDSLNTFIQKLTKG
jgi:peptidoglycan/xylan/chitin deacetylase (PgdA/CDA1 family)